MVEQCCAEVPARGLLHGTCKRMHLQSLFHEVINQPKTIVRETLNRVRS